MLVSSFIGFRYLKGRTGDPFSRFISILSTMGIAIGVMSLITVMSVMQGFQGQLKMRMLDLLPHAIVSPLDKNNQTLSIDTQSPIPDSINKLGPQLTNISPVTQAEAIFQSEKGLTAGIILGITDKNTIFNYIIDTPANQDLSYLLEAYCFWSLFFRH